MIKILNINRYYDDNTLLLFELKSLFQLLYYFYLMPSNITKHIRLLSYDE